jgi:O-antigen/teichoic acid export membrane protein
VTVSIRPEPRFAFARSLLQRSGSRVRALREAVVLSVVVKLLAYINVILSIKLALPYLGQARFGAFATATSIASFAVVAELGIGHGLVNIAATSTKEGLNRHLSSAFIVSIIVAIAFLVLLTGIGGGVQAFGSGNNLTTFACLAAIGAMITGLPVSVFTRALVGLRAYRFVYLPQIVGQLLATATLVVLTHYRAGPIGLLMARALPPVIVGYAGMAAALALPTLSLRIQFSLASMDSVRHILSIGIAPFVSQIASGLLFSAQTWAVAALCGVAAAVEPFSISRLTSLALMSAALLTQPLWPEYARLAAANAWSDIRRTLVVSTGVVAALNGAFLLALAATWSHWVHFLHIPLDQESWLVFALLATVSFLMCVRDALNMASLGIGYAPFSTVVFVVSSVSLCVVIFTSPGGWRVPHVLAFFLVAELCLIIACLTELRRAEIANRKMSPGPKPA